MLCKVWLRMNQTPASPLARKAEVASCRVTLSHCCCAQLCAYARVLAAAAVHLDQLMLLVS